MASKVDGHQHRYLALDSLRGICACMIILHHLPGPFEATPFAKNAYLFVDFFFVLSGFVIGSSYGDRLAGSYPISRYMLLRFFRVYPLHVAMLLVFLAFELSLASGLLGATDRPTFTDGYTLRRLVECLLLIQPFLGPDGTPWNGPAWSIATEFWTYLLFALTMKVAPRFIVPLCVIIVITAPLSLAIGSDRYMYVFHDGALTRCLFGFATGIICWKLLGMGRETRMDPLVSLGLELGATCLCLTLVYWAGAGRLSLLAPVVFAVAVLVFAREGGALSRMLCSRPLVEVGKLSYSIYMVHLFIIWRALNALSVVDKVTGWNMVEQHGAGTRLVDNLLVSSALSIGLLAGILVAAWATHKFIEMPGRDLGRRLAARDRSSRSPPTVEAAKIG